MGERPINHFIAALCCQGVPQNLSSTIETSTRLLSAAISFQSDADIPLASAG
jgi:hypothetical protein